MLARIFICSVFLAGYINCFCQQFYFKGRFTDSAGNQVAFVKLKPGHSSLPFQAGNTGDFGIPSGYKSDSVLCYLSGYDTARVLLHHDAFNVIVMRLSKEAIATAKRNGSLSSSPQTKAPDQWNGYETRGGEEYSAITFNQWVNTSQHKQTSVVPNSNRASYSNIRRFISQRTRVPANAVRIDEVWNYFQPKLPQLQPHDKQFSLGSFIGKSPWDSSTYLVMLNAMAPKLETEKLPPANLVFLIDNSGSMETSNRLPLLKAGFSMLVNHMRPKDKIAIVTYGGSAGVALAPTYVEHKERILEVINAIEAGGATPGSNGIQLAYELATTNPVANGINRVILATDGDFNIGLVAEEDLEILIKRYQFSGVTLSCLGVGMGNYKDNKIEILARWGKGNFAYLDTEDEAQKVMVEEFTQNLYASAYNVQLQFTTEPDLVNSYRLLGYDNKTEALQQGGELIGSLLGSGQTVTAMVEIKTNRPLKIGDHPLKWGVRYMASPAPDEASMSWLWHEQYAEFQQADSSPYCFTKASTLAWYALMLREAANAQPVMFTSIINQVKRQNDTDTLWQGFADLLEKTASLYDRPEPAPQPNKKKEAKKKRS